MQCEDNSKLRTPLSEVCQTTDIGCVPIVDGKPDCSPMPDELPIAFDPKTTTLWLFSCKTHEWIPFQKFTMCQLEALNLDNIRDICDALNIGVNYAGSGECKQGTITLRELAERILECIQLETKIITIGEGEGNKVKISIEGLPLDPVYVTGRNIWSEGGSGTEADPLRIATYDPICKWPVKTQADVNAASVKHLGACLDGEMSRVPYPVMPCSYPQITPEEMMAAMDKDLIVCVDGENLKVPVPYNLYEASPCASPLYTIQDTQAAGGRITILACDGGQTIRIPIEGSGFFSYNTDWIYECVPQTTGVPTSVPVSGTGPLRIDCDNSLWVWDCEGAGWRKVKDGLADVPWLANRKDIPDLCENLKFKGWYNTEGTDVCNTQEVYFRLSQLVKMIDDCVNSTTVCKNPIEYFHRSNFSRKDERTFKLKKITLVSLDNPPEFSAGGYYIAIYNVRKGVWERGSGEVWDDETATRTDDESAGRRTFNVTNPYDCTCFYNIKNSAVIVQTADDYTNDYSVALISFCSMTEDANWQQFQNLDEYSGGDAPTRRYAVATWNSKVHTNTGNWSQNKTFTTRVDGVCPIGVEGELAPDETHTYYMHSFLVISSKTQTIEESPWVVRGFGAYADIERVRGIRFRV